MQSFKKIMSVLVCLLALNACGTEQGNFKTDKYSLVLPSNWKEVRADEQDLNGLDAVFFAFDNQGQVQSSLSIFHKAGNQITDPTSYVQAELQSLSKLKEFESIKSEKVTIAKIKTQLETFQAWDDGSQSIKQFIQTYLPVNDGVYVLTASLPVTANKAALNDVKKVIKSFTLLASGVNN